MGMSAALLDWRREQKRGAIMEPAKFDELVRKMMAKYKVNRKRAEKIVGKIYWRTAKDKFQKSQKSREESSVAEVLKRKMKG